MHKQRVVLLIVASLGLLSAFLPWLTIMIIGVTGMDIGQGWVVLALFGVAIAGIITDKRQTPITGSMRFLLSLIGAAAAGFGVWKLIQIRQGKLEVAGEIGELGRIGDGLDGMFAGMFELGFGLYILIGAGALLAILPLIRRRSVLLPG